MQQLKYWYAVENRTQLAKRFNTSYVNVANALTRRRWTKEMARQHKRECDENNQGLVARGTNYELCLRD